MRFDSAEDQVSSQAAEKLDSAHLPSCRSICHTWRANAKLSSLHCIFCNLMEKLLRYPRRCATAAWRCSPSSASQSKPGSPARDPWKTRRTTFVTPSAPTVRPPCHASSVCQPLTLCGPQAGAAKTFCLPRETGIHALCLKQKVKHFSYLHMRLSWQRATCHLAPMFTRKFAHCKVKRTPHVKGCGLCRSLHLRRPRHQRRWRLCSHLCSRPHCRADAWKEGEQRRKRRPSPHHQQPQPDRSVILASQDGTQRQSRAIQHTAARIPASMRLHEAAVHDFSPFRISNRSPQHCCRPTCNLWLLVVFLLCYQVAQKGKQ